MVPVVRSTFRILEELARGGPLGLNEVTQRSGVSKSTVFRILATLRQLGYVVRDENRNYYGSRTVGDLVSTTGNTEAIRRAALPHMLKLRDLYGETVNLGQRELDKVVYIEVVPSEFALRFEERPGSTIYVHASALGKVILAFSDEWTVEGVLQGRELPMLTRNTIIDATELMTELKRIRDAGLAFDRGETSASATCVAVPILDASKHAIAALSISGPSSRFHPRKDSPVVEDLLRVAAAISNSPQTTRRGRSLHGGRSSRRG